MSKLFSPDSKFYRVMSAVGDLIILNFIFMISCLPVLTVGAAAVALYRGVLAIRRDEGSSPARVYWDTFRREWKQATVLWLLLLLCAVVPAAAVFWYYRHGSPSVPILALAILTVFFYFSVLSYAFPLQAQFRNTTLRIIKNAVILTWAYPLRSLAMVAINILPAVNLALFPYWFLRLGFFWFSLGFALLCYGDTGILRPVFSKLSRPK